MDINLRNRRYRELRKHLDTIDRNVLAEAMFKYFKKKVGDVLGPGTSIFGSKKLDGLLEIARGVIERLQEVPKEEKVTEKKLNEDLEILWDALRQLNDIKDLTLSVPEASRAHETDCLAIRDAIAVQNQTRNANSINLTIVDMRNPSTKVPPVPKFVSPTYKVIRNHIKSAGSAATSPDLWARRSKRHIRTAQGYSWECIERDDQIPEDGATIQYVIPTNDYIVILRAFFPQGREDLVPVDFPKPSRPVGDYLSNLWENTIVNAWRIEDGGTEREVSLREDLDTRLCLSKTNNLVVYIRPRDEERSHGCCGCCIVC